MKKKRRYEDDDGRVVARMNVEGMPWHTAAPGGENSYEPEKEPLHLTKEESRAFAWGAVKAALLICVAFSVAAILFILFCTNIWFT